MIRVLIPTDTDFALFKNECKKLYEQNQDKIGDTSSFEFIINSTFFYIFLNDNNLIGCIYYFVDEEKKLFLNGFSKRKTHLLNLECLKMSLNWFDCDIYAQAQNRMSALCLLKCGFCRISQNIFIKKKTQVEQCSGKGNYVF